MREFQSSVVIARDVAQVLRAFWRLETWPTFTRHVPQIDIHFEDENVQVLSMHVDTRGKRDVFKSVRIRQENVIHYFQPTPPRTLRFHRGTWAFALVNGSTEVTCTHTIIVDPIGCQEFFLGTGAMLNVQDAQAKLEEVIRHNSNETMLALKGYLESAPLGEKVAS